MSESGAVPVARKKRAAEPPEDNKPAEVDRSKWSKQPVIFQMRGDEPYKEVMLELAEFDGLRNLSDLVDRALRHYGRAVNFPKTFPKR